MAIDAAMREELRRRVDGWRAAEAREIAERRVDEVLSPNDAWEFSLELWELNPGAFQLADPARERGAAEARAQWIKLRKRFGWRPASDHPR